MKRNLDFLRPKDNAEAEQRILQMAREFEKVDKYEIDSGEPLQNTNSSKFMKDITVELFFPNGADGLEKFQKEEQIELDYVELLTATYNMEEGSAIMVNCDTDETMMYQVFGLLGHIERKHRVSMLRYIAKTVGMGWKMQPILAWTRIATAYYLGFEDDGDISAADVAMNCAHEKKQEKA